MLQLRWKTCAGVYVWCLNCLISDAVTLFYFRHFNGRELTHDEMQRLLLEPENRPRHDDVTADDVTGDDVTADTPNGDEAKDDAETNLEKAAEERGIPIGGATGGGTECVLVGSSSPKTPTKTTILSPRRYSVFSSLLELKSQHNCADYDRLKECSAPDFCGEKLRPQH